MELPSIASAYSHTFLGSVIYINFVLYAGLHLSQPSFQVFLLYWEVHHWITEHTHNPVTDACLYESQRCIYHVFWIQEFEIAHTKHKVHWGWLESARCFLLISEDLQSYLYKERVCLLNEQQRIWRWSCSEHDILDTSIRLPLKGKNNFYEMIERGVGAGNISRSMCPSSGHIQRRQH